MSEQREMTLKEYCAQLPDFHLVNKQLAVLVKREEQLMNLVCIIHQDGGQYIGKHGEEKAINDAEKWAAYCVQTVIAKRLFS